MDLQGSEWGDRSRAAEVKFFGVLAHEISHLYTAQTRKDFARIAWMNEGGADYFANRLARSVGLIDQKQFDARIAAAIEECKRLRKTSSDSLVLPAPRSNPGVAYQCGMVVHAAMAKLLSKANPSRSFFAFWGDLIRNAESSGGHYSEKEYFDLAR